MSPTAKEAALNGGKPFNAKLITGATETVFVRALGIRDFPKYLAIYEEEAECAEFLVEKPTGWADNFDPDSIGELVKLGEEVNAPFFKPWVQRRLARKQRLMESLSNESKKEA